MSNGFNQWMASPGIASALSDVGSRLQFGPHQVASDQGERVVGLVRALPRADALTRQRTLAQLLALQEQGNPEATTFFGFATEYGLFGVRRDVKKAGQYYQAAANAGYPPAIFDLALRDAYGRGQRQNLRSALDRLQRANAAPGDRSYRVCGMQAFVMMKLAPAVPELLTAHCHSPLADLAAAATAPGDITPAEVDTLHRSMVTGADDGDLVIESRTAHLVGSGNLSAAATYCRYRLLNQFRAGALVHGELQADAWHCLQPSIPQSADDATRRRAAQAAGGIASFVVADAAAIDRMRRTNHFHYSWSVPYLPFTAEDAVLFEPLMPNAARRFGEAP